MEEDDSTGDVFECKVGNLPPHTFAQVKFTFVTHCKVQNEGECATTFVYPCVLGPRYTPTPSAGDGNNTQTAQDDSEFNCTSKTTKLAVTDFRFCKIFKYENKCHHYCFFYNILIHNYLLEYFNIF